MANTPIPWGPNSPLVVKVGIESAFGTYTATPLYIRQNGIPDIGGLQRYMIPDPTMRGDQHVVHPHVISNTGCLDPGASLSLVTPLFGLKGTAPSGTDMADAATDATGHPMCLLFDALFGSETACDLYTITTVTGCSKTDLTVSADPAGFTLGGGFVIDSSEAGTTGAQYEVGFAKTLTTGPPAHIIPRVTLLRTPDTAGTAIIYGGITYVPAAYVSKTVSMLIMGPLVDTTTPLYLQLMGVGVKSAVIDFKAGEPATVTWSLWPTGHAWTSNSGTGATAQAWAYPDAEEAAGGAWTIDGTSIRVASGSITIDPGVADIPAHGAAYDRAGFMSTGSADGIATIKLEVISDETVSQTIRTAFNTQASVSLQGWHGSAPGRMWAVAMPAAHISALSDPVENGGSYVQSVTFRPQSYTGDTGTSSECGDKPFYFWLG